MRHDIPTIIRDYDQRDTFHSSLSSSRSTIQKSNSDPIRFINDIDQVDDYPSSCCWVWKIQILLPIPMFHLDEWNDLTVDNLPLDTITTRISEFMRLGSIQCDYDNNHGKVTCRTSTSLHFVVQLWQSGAARKGDANTVILVVQIQKVQGCSFEFQEVRRDLSNAILSPQQRAMPSPTSSQHQQLQTTANMICNDFHPPPFDSGCSCDQQHAGGTTTRSALDLSLQLLKSKLASETRLGLESLVIFTDPSKTMREDVDSASRAVLLDSGIQRLLANYFILPLLLETSSKDDMMAIDDDDVDDEYHRRMYMMALRIISNSLEWVATTNLRHRHDEEQGSWCSSSYVDLLSSPASSSPFGLQLWQSISFDLRLASQRPQEAILSSRCLRFLMLLQTTRALLEEKKEGSQEKEQGTWCTADDGCLTDWLLDANIYGKQFNLSLEQETKKLLAQVYRDS
jgi:hypothetical protein